MSFPKITQHEVAYRYVLVAIKIDTEGYEANVINGGPHLHLLKRCTDLILTEFSGACIKDEGGDPLEAMIQFPDTRY